MLEIRDTMYIQHNDNVIVVWTFSCLVMFYDRLYGTCKLANSCIIMQVHLDKHSALPGDINIAGGSYSIS